MLLKRQSYDNDHRMVTVWAANVSSAIRRYDEHWQADVIDLRFGDGHPNESVLLNRGEGVYLCSDSGRTIEVLSRLKTNDKEN